MKDGQQGGLFFKSGNWYGRWYATIDGERIRVTRCLHTASKAVARRKLARLITGGTADRTEVTRAETVAEAVERIVTQQQADGLKTWKERRQRLADYALPDLGRLLVTQVRPSHVREVLDRTVAAGKARQTVVHLKNDLNSIFGDLWRDEDITENPVARVKVPKSAPTDDRKRVILTDEEFAVFVASAAVDPELRMMALTSRCFGGMRTSDLHAWDWAHVDTDQWRDAHVPRPKTRSGERIALPVLLVPELRAWWDENDRPLRGPVFPVRKGDRAGERKRKSSYAKALRRALWEAGIVRPLPGFDEAVATWATLRKRGADSDDPGELAKAESNARSLCALQSATEESKPLDFHSFRRSYATALAATGLNAQQSMRLAGHRAMATHMRYVMAADVLVTPEGALPKLRSPAPVSDGIGILEIPIDLPAEIDSSMFSSGRDRFRTCDIRLVRPALCR